MKSIFLNMSPSPDPVSITALMQMPPGVYAGQTLEGNDAAILIRKHEPIMDIRVVKTDRIVHVYEFFSNGTVNEWDQIMNI